MNPRLWVSVAGASGFLSVGLAAYGSHSLSEHAIGKDLERRKDLWKVGNQFHMIHSLALLGVPLIKNPFCHVAGAALTLGIIGFSGSMYSSAYTGEKVFDPTVTKSSGGLLGLGWAMFCFFPRL